MSDKCPKCGAERVEYERVGAFVYSCGTRAYERRGNFPAHVDKSLECVRRQLADATARAEANQGLADIVYELAPSLKEEGPDGFSGYFAHFDEFTGHIQAAWPQEQLGYSQSPWELLTRLIDERDDLARQLAQEREKTTRLQGELQLTQNGARVVGQLVVAYRSQLKDLAGHEYDLPAALREAETATAYRPGSTPALDKWCKEQAELRADNARLQAIVDKLPKTADGVAILPGMEVCIPHITADPFHILALHKCPGVGLVPQTQEFPQLAIRADAMYSTRAAAEAAQMAEPPTKE